MASCGFCNKLVELFFTPIFSFLILVLGNAIACIVILTLDIRSSGLGSNHSPGDYVVVLSATTGCSSEFNAGDNLAMD